MNSVYANPSWKKPSYEYKTEASKANQPLHLRLYLGIAFLVGLFRIFTVPLVGQLPLGEILLAGVLAHGFLWIILTHTLPNQIAAPKLLLVFLLTQILAFCGYIFADLWRHSLPVDMIRGWMRMVFVLIDILGLALLFGKNRDAFIWIQIGAIFSLFQCFFTPPLFGAYWKFGFAYPLTILLLLTAPRMFGLLGASVACAGMGVLHSILAFRSLGAICLLVAALNLIIALPLHLRRIILIASTTGVMIALPILAANKFNNKAGNSNRSDVERSAMVQAAWEGFAQSPFIGNGSWFSNSDVMDNFLLIRTQKAREAGGGMGFKDNDFEGIAIHSQILTSLAEGGIMGGTFFFCYFCMIIRTFWVTLANRKWTWQTPLEIFILIISFWDLMMSPFSGPARINISITVVLILLIAQEKQSAPDTSKLKLRIAT